MTQSGQTPEKTGAARALKLTVAGVVGQVGCLTLAIIVVALFAGLWLDAQFDTKPLFALVFVLASVPLTIYLMFRIVLGIAPKIQLGMDQTMGKTTEEKSEVGEKRRETQET
jgi:F0F1-type ATP synthase assembly protein I